MRAALLALCLAACGGPVDDGAESVFRSPVYKIRQLPGPYADFFKPEVFDASAGHVIDGLAASGLDRSDMAAGMQEARVDAVGGPFPCILSRGNCNGQTQDFKLIVATRPNGLDVCPWDTALAHEMIHFLLEYETGDSDANHTRPNTWQLQEPLRECP